MPRPERKCDRCGRPTWPRDPEPGKPILCIHCWQDEPEEVWVKVTCFGCGCKLWVQFSVVRSTSREWRCHECDQETLARVYEQERANGSAITVRRRACEDCGKQQFYRCPYRWHVGPRCPKCRCELRSRKQREARARKRWGMTCQFCGDPITANRSDVKFCSNKCRQAAFRAKARLQAALTNGGPT